MGGFISRPPTQAHMAPVIYEANFAVNDVRLSQMAELLVSCPAFGTGEVPEAHNGKDGGFHRRRLLPPVESLQGPRRLKAACD